MPRLESISEKAIEAIERGEILCLCTISAASGATPRGEGTRMLVDRKGRIGGTVGGGAVEYQALQAAGRCLDTQKEGKSAYALRPGAAADIGMVCGGDLSIAYQLLGEEELPALRRLAKAEKERCDLVLIQDFSRISGRALFFSDEIDSLDFPGKEEVVQRLRERAFGIYRLPLTTPPSENCDIPVPPSDTADEKKRSARENKGEAETALHEADFFLERIGIPGFVHIFGGGHVAQALVPCLSALDFACVVHEDRDAFLQKELFPMAYDVRRVDFEAIHKTVALQEEDYAVVMSRGHSWDLVLQAQILRTDVHYIGVIGSRRKRAFTDSRLREYGFGPEDLARVISPIGLEIGAETPAEIAVSIAAQLIQTRHDRREALCGLS